MVRQHESVGAARRGRPTGQRWPPWFAAAVVGTAAVLAAIVAAKLTRGFPVRYFTADPETAFRELTGAVNVTPLIGGVSLLGTIAWAASARVLVVVGLARRDSWCLQLAGITAYLLLDDTFQIHEWLLPKLGRRGEQVGLAVLVAVVLIVLWRQRRRLPATPWPVLALAFAGLGGSLAVDQVNQLFLGADQVDKDWMSLAEDGAKLLNIFAWTAYAAALSLRLLGAPAGAPARDD